MNCMRQRADSLRCVEVKNVLSDLSEHAIETRDLVLQHCTRQLSTITVCYLFEMIQRPSEQLIITSQHRQKMHTSAQTVDESPRNHKTLNDLEIVYIIYLLMNHKNTSNDE